MVGTKEFEELQKQFEKDIKLIAYGHQVERATGNIKGEFYNDGYINNIFKAYMYGYAYSKGINQN